MDRYLQFPPPGLQPGFTNDDPQADCDTFSEFLINIQIVNPCFSVYDITRACPILNDPLARNIGNVPTAHFNRTDVRHAIHAPRNFRHPGLPLPPRGYNRVWFECASLALNPFVCPYDGEGPEAQNDRSPDPIQGALPQVIEATNRVLITYGNLDAIIITNGTLLAIQNMTWGGELGFQTAPSQDFVVPGQGVMGRQQ